PAAFPYTTLFRSGERTGFCGGLRDLSAFRGRNRFVFRNRRCAGRISGLRSAVQKRMRRFRLTSLVAGAVLAGVISSPASAQEQDVARRSYPFFQRTLTIAVNAAVPGELQILRSRAAR